MQMLSAWGGWWGAPGRPSETVKCGAEALGFWRETILNATGLGGAFGSNRGRHPDPGFLRAVSTWASPFQTLPTSAHMIYSWRAPCFGKGHAHPHLPRAVAGSRGSGAKKRGARLPFAGPGKPGVRARGGRRSSVSPRKILSRAEKQQAGLRPPASPPGDPPAPHTEVRPGHYALCNAHRGAARRLCPLQRGVGGSVRRHFQATSPRCAHTLSGAPGCHLRGPYSPCSPHPPLLSEYRQKQSRGG